MKPGSAQRKKHVFHPLGGNLLETRGDLNLALLKDTAIPNFGPGLGGVTENIPGRCTNFSFVRQTDVRTKNDRTGAKIEQRRNTFCKLDLFLFIKEVEEVGGVDDGDASA